MDDKVLGTVDTAGAYLHLLPDTEHEVRLRLDDILEVGNTDLFEVLIGNRQVRPVADSLSQYPTVQLQVFPNVLESTGYSIAIPMTKEGEGSGEEPNGIRGEGRPGLHSQEAPQTQW